jgi:hypothetical protein
MSDFIEHLINRHLGKGEMVLPRARAKFEPDAAAAFLPQDIEEESQPITAAVPGENSLANVPAANTITHAKDDSDVVNSNIEKQPVHHHQQRKSVIQSLEVETPVYPSVSGITSEPADKDKNKVLPEDLPDEHDAAGHPPPGFVRQEGTDTEKSSLPPVEQRDYLKPGYPGNPIHIAMNKTQEAPDDQRSQQRPSKAPERSPSTGLPIDFTEPEQVMVESQPVFTGIQNTGMEDTGTEVDGLLEAPAWLSEKQHELHKELVVNDSKAETEPVINVTIGRIEVRANQSPPPEQTGKKKKPSGIMSLETYLGQCK